MSSTIETQKLASAARFEQKLQRPENQLNAIRLLQALTVKEIYGAKRQLDSIEAEFCELQQSNIAGAVRNEGVEKQLEELRKDKESFRLLISEAEGGTKNTKDSLESLRTKVKDEYFKLTADNVRFTKDIKTLNKQIDRHQERLCSVEKSVGDFRAKLPRPQDITKLNDRLARLEPMVKSMYDKLDKVSTLTRDQREVFKEAVDNQARIRRFLDTFIPKQEDFLEFLDKLPKPAPSSTSNEYFTDVAVDGGNATRLFTLPSSGPRPPLRAVQMLEQYNHFSSSYRIKRPKSEARFIRQYLKKIDHRAAWFIQIKLQQEYPELVESLQRPETSNKTDVMIFISVDRLSWDHIKTIMRKINGKELFSLLETGQEEQGMSTTNKRLQITIA
ncbi:hypothetical protein GGS26DRAFT_538590 [Hypomontagnella submonticulosa]|nr:hypothetical protein GGS26DRAFT_538590 [Hypomontagnella submonticulosa]